MCAPPGSEDIHASGESHIRPHCRLTSDQELCPNLQMPKTGPPEVPDRGRLVPQEDQFVARIDDDTFSDLMTFDDTLSNPTPLFSDIR